MINKKKKRSRLTSALLETAADMKKAGVLSKAAHDKITLRHLGKDGKAEPKKLTPKRIRTLREDARMSQAVFAHYLNLTPGYISQLERGTKQPTGAALALLNVIHRKGIETVL